MNKPKPGNTARGMDGAGVVRTKHAVIAKALAKGEECQESRASELSGTKRVRSASVEAHEGENVPTALTFKPGKALKEAMFTPECASTCSTASGDARANRRLIQADCAATLTSVRRLVAPPTPADQNSGSEAARQPLRACPRSIPCESNAGQGDVPRPVPDPKRLPFDVTHLVCFRRQCSCISPCRAVW